MLQRAMPTSLTLGRETGPCSAPGWYTALGKYPCCRYSANWTHNKAWKLSTGALPPLWAAVRPRSTFPGWKLPLGSLLTPLDCPTKYQSHGGLLQHVRHRGTSSTFSQVMLTGVLLLGRSFPQCCSCLLSLGGSWRHASLHSSAWDAIFKAGREGLYGIFKAAHLGKFLLAPELAFASQVNIQSA